MLDSFDTGGGVHTHGKNQVIQYGGYRIKVYADRIDTSPGWTGKAMIEWWAGCDIRTHVVHTASNNPLATEEEAIAEAVARAERWVDAKEPARYTDQPR